MKRTVSSVCFALLSIVFGFLVGRLEQRESAFAQQNGQCGNINGDEAVDITDAIYLLDWLFGGGPEPMCSDFTRIDELETELAECRQTRQQPMATGQMLCNIAMIQRLVATTIEGCRMSTSFKVSRFTTACSQPSTHHSKCLS